MIILDVDNRYVSIKGAPLKIIRKLEKICSYKVAGAYFAPSFQRKQWDGREHLLKYNRKHGYRAPVGLLEDIARCLRKLKLKCKIKTKRRRMPKAVERVFYAWNTSIQLRPYQDGAVDSITAPGLFQGCGILAMPIRSGKTKTAARVICDMAVRTIILVPSQLLLHQTAEALSEALMCEVGKIGDGLWDEKDVTVATLQTLAIARGGERVTGEGKHKKKTTLPRDPRFTKLLKNYDMVIFDECHHLVADGWHDVMMELDMPFRVGLSATAYLDHETEVERGVIWLKACCGNVRYTISTSKLIEQGYLMAPDIKMYCVTQPALQNNRWSQKLINAAIYENPKRNFMITKLAVRYANQGMKVLIVTNRLNQVDLLSKSLSKRDVTHEVITGKQTGPIRATRIANFLAGRTQILVGTIFAEGVDIPSMECVINAEGGKDAKATVQRMRNLTVSEGKDQAIFIDFIDLTNKYFAKHSQERLAVYRTEPAFKIRLFKTIGDK